MMHIQSATDAIERLCHFSLPSGSMFTFLRPSIYDTILHDYACEQFRLWHKLCHTPPTFIRLDLACLLHAPLPHTFFSTFPRVLWNSLAVDWVKDRVYPNQNPAPGLLVVASKLLPRTSDYSTSFSLDLNCCSKSHHFHLSIPSSHELYRTTNIGLEGTGARPG